MYVLADPRADHTGQVIRDLGYRYVVSPRGEYVHIPRTAQWHHRFGESWLCVELLCGQHVRNPTLTNDPAGALCGTCHGRELGLSEPDVIYRPRTVHWLPRTWCVGSGPHRRLWVDIPGFRHVRCLMCNQTVRWWGDGPVRHHHTSTAMTCPAHGHQRLYTRGDRVVCLAWQCDHTPYRFWVISPHGRPDTS